MSPLREMPKLPCGSCTDEQTIFTFYALRFTHLTACTSFDVNIAFIVDFRINETPQIGRRCFQSRFIGIPPVPMQSGRIGTSRFNSPRIGKRCFQLRRFNRPPHLCSKLVGAVSNCADAVRLETAPTGGESAYLFLEFTMIYYT